MNMLNRFSQLATWCVCALLLCFCFAAEAEDLQDINKLFKQGKQDQALVRVNAYLASKPKDAQARFLKGLILTDQEKTTEAIRVFSELTEDFPELPEPYNNLAVLYAGHGQYDKARIALEMAIRTHPSYATAHENLGDIYAKMASQAYDRALQLDHANTGTQTKLAMLKDIFAVGGIKAVKPGKATRKAAAASVTEAEGSAATPAASGHVAEIPASAVAPATESDAKEKENVASASTDDSVVNVLHHWAAAWSAKDVKTYLTFYAADFKTPDNISRADWEALRNERINKPKSIQISLSNIKVKLIDDGHATATFKQTYRASHMHTHSVKTLVLIKSGNTWLIQEERS